MLWPPACVWHGMKVQIRSVFALDHTCNICVHTNTSDKRHKALYCHHKQKHPCYIRNQNKAPRSSFWGDSWLWTSCTIAIIHACTISHYKDVHINGERRGTPPTTKPTMPVSPFLYSLDDSCPRHSHSPSNYAVIFEWMHLCTCQEYWVRA